MKETFPDNPEGLLYPMPDGRMRSIESYERNFRMICNKLRIDRDCRKKDCLGRAYGLNTHALRHTGITMANSAEGANAIITAQVAGHSVRYAAGLDLGSDAVYTHAILSELRKVQTPSMLLGYGPEPAWDGSGQDAEERVPQKEIRGFRQDPSSRLLLRMICKMEEEGMSSEAILRIIKAAIGQ